MIDLHSHTNESDGTLSPEDLVQLAIQSGLEALAITDHDTFAGYEKAIDTAKATNLELVCGIELNSRLERAGERARSVHVLAYFPDGTAGKPFHSWLQSQRDERRDRNRKLSARLAEQGVLVSLAEVEAHGKSLAGRPHFARLLVEKGYVRTLDEAFKRYIGEDAPTFVERQSPSTVEVIRFVREGGGVPVVAHPIRIGLQGTSEERVLLASLKKDGLLGLEVFHSEHDEGTQAHYVRLADQLGLIPTGGSDFHGAIKPDIKLGSGRQGNVRVPFEFISGLKRVAKTVS